MSSARGRQIQFLAAAALAFALWIGYLIFLAVEEGSPILLSRPQFLVSSVDVIAEVDSLDSNKLKVKKVCWPKENAPVAEGQEIEVVNLADCARPPADVSGNRPAYGWDGKGPYILPLVSAGKSYRVVSVPRSPGFGGGSQPRIYKATTETELQLEEIHRAAK